MFEDTLKYIRELEQTAESTSAFLSKLRGARRRLINKMNKAEESIKEQKNVDAFVTKILPQVEKAVLKEAPDVLKGSILEAIRTNHEFDWTSYKRALAGAANDKDIYYLVNLGGVGWNKRFSFIVDLKKSAGSLEDWANGIKRYRRILEERKREKIRESAKKKGKKRPARFPKYDPIKASKAWAGIFEGRNDSGVFSTTIRNRLQLSGRKAPFWQLLNFGAVSMTSDRGGYPTPQGEPTNFILKTETILQEQAENLLRLQQEKYEKLIDDYRKNIDEAEEVLESLESLIERIRLEVKQVRQLEKEFGEDLQYIDSNKFERAVQLIREGLLKTGRVELTLSGSGKRIRPTVSRLTRLLFGEY